MPTDPDHDHPLSIVSTPLGRFLVSDAPMPDDLPNPDEPECSFTMLTDPIGEPETPAPPPLRQRILHPFRRRDPHRETLRQEINQALLSADAELHRSFDELRRDYARRSAARAPQPTDDPAPIVAPDVIETNEE